MLKNTLLLAALLSIMLSSCKVYFTQELREQVEKQGISLQDIQFYNSRKIIMQRIERTNTIIEDTTKLRQSETIELERIKIKRNRPCVSKFSDSTTIQVMFDPNSESTLRFVRTNTTDKYARYKIGAIRWEGEVGVIPYDSTIYYLQPRNYFFQPRSKDASLKVKKRFLRKWKIKLRKLKGVKVPKK